MLHDPEALKTEYFRFREVASIEGKHYRATRAYAIVPAGSIGRVSGIYLAPGDGGWYGVDVTWEGIAGGRALDLERGGLTDGFSKTDLVLRFTSGPHAGERAMVPLDGGP